MPKATITINETDVPEALKPFYKDGKIEVWSNANDLALAGELNPTLEESRNTILGEKRTLESQYNALKTASTDKEIDAAKLIIERDALKNQLPSADDTKLLTSVKTIFNNAPVSEVEEKLPKLLEDSQYAAQARKNEQHQKLFEASGFKNPKVFIKLMNDPSNLEGIEGDPFVQTVEGTTNKALFVKVKDGNGVEQTVKFDDWRKDKDGWNDFLPALMNGGTTSENQTWLGQNPPIEGDKGKPKPEWQKRVEAENEKNKAAQPAFTSSLPSIAPVEMAQPNKQS